MEISAQLCINNIYHLAKEKNIKIGDLEKEAKVSPGYFSRLTKKDVISFPQIETLCVVAQMLNVTLDSLITVDFTKIPEEHSQLFTFIDKLIDEADENKDVVWKKIDLDNINKSTFPNELYKIVFSNAGRNNTIESKDVRYSSLFTKETLILVRDILWYQIDQGTIVFLFNPFITELSHSGIDMVFSVGGSLVPVCSANQRDSGVLYNKLEELYHAAYVSSRRIVFDKRAQEVILKYIT